MRIKEHRIVGKYIADQCCKFTKAASRSAFMTGAALPSNKSRSIKNCLEQTLKYLDILTEKKRCEWKVRDYYNAGRLIYFISESFSGLNKAYYSAMPFDRFVYNRELGRILHDYTGSQDGCGEKACDESLYEYICKCHIKFITSSTTACEDCRLIIRMTCAAARELIPDVAA